MNAKIEVAQTPEIKRNILMSSGKYEMHPLSGRTERLVVEERQDSTARFCLTGIGQSAWESVEVWAMHEKGWGDKRKFCVAVVELDGHRNPSLLRADVFSQGAKKKLEIRGGKIDGLLRLAVDHIDDWERSYRESSDYYDVWSYDHYLDREAVQYMQELLNNRRLAKRINYWT